MVSIKKELTRWFLGIVKISKNVRNTCFHWLDRTFKYLVFVLIRLRMTKKESVSCRSQDLSQIPVQTVSLSERMIGYNYLSKYNDWHDDFIISWHDKRIFLFEISKASDPTHARQGYNCRELEIVNDNNILMQTSFNFQLKQYFQTVECFW